jgi:hypothetical protein
MSFKTGSPLTFSALLQTERGEHAELDFGGNPACLMCYAMMKKGRASEKVFL